MLSCKKTQTLAANSASFRHLPQPWSYYSRNAPNKRLDTHRSQPTDVHMHATSTSRHETNTTEVTFYSSLASARKVSMSALRLLIL
eukprot:6344032-Amphidinium_carterae.1